MVKKGVSISCHTTVGFENQGPNGDPTSVFNQASGKVYPELAGRSNLDSKYQVEPFFINIPGAKSGDTGGKKVFWWG